MTSASPKWGINGACAFCREGGRSPNNDGTTSFANRKSTQSSLNSHTSRYNSSEATARDCASSGVETLKRRTTSRPYLAEDLDEAPRDGDVYEDLEFTIEDPWESPRIFCTTEFVKRLQGACCFGFGR